MAPESRFHTILKHKILDVMRNREEDLVRGRVEDFSSYKFLVGNLTGLREALSLCEETEREFDV